MTTSAAGIYGNFGQANYSAGQFDAIPQVLVDHVFLLCGKSCNNLWIGDGRTDDVLTHDDCKI